MPDNEIVATPERKRFRWEDLGTMKLTPVVVVAFFGLLAVMSGLAAVVGYTVHRLAKPSPHAQQSSVPPRP